MINHKITFKSLSEKDTALVYNLGRSQFGKDFWFTKKFIRETMRQSGYHFGAFQGKELIGAILVDKFDRPKLWIFFFLVRKTHRRKGIGKELLAKIEKKHAKNYPLLFTDFSPQDKEAKNFYEKHGFSQRAEINDWFGIDDPGLIYAKKLRQA